MGYLEDIVIDKGKLDDECVRFAGVFDVWARVLAEAERGMDVTKDTLKVVEAQVELEFRKLGSDGLVKEYGVKLTEQAVVVLVIDDHRVRKAKVAYLNAKYAYDVAKQAVRSFDKKSDRLDNLVKLHGQGYFAEIQGSETKGVIMTNLRAKYAAAIKQAGVVGKVEPMQPKQKTRKTKKAGPGVSREAL